MFTARSGATIDLDSIEQLSIRRLARPAPAESPDEADVYELEMRDWSTFPFEVVAEDEGRRQIYFYGEEARALARAWYEGMTPWIS